MRGISPAHVTRHDGVSEGARDVEDVVRVSRAEAQGCTLHKGVETICAVSRAGVRCRAGISRVCVSMRTQGSQKPSMKLHT